MIELKVDDFNFDDDGGATAFTKIGKFDDVYISVEVNENSPQKDEIGEFLVEINYSLNWLNTNKSLLDKSLIKGKALELAKVWTSELEVIQSDDEDYITISGEKVSVPISTVDFLASLELVAVGIEIETGENRTFFNLYYGTKPDFFNGKSLELFIDFNKEIEFLGLVDLYE